MTQDQILSQLKKILSFSEELVNSDLQEELIYDMIFSEKISRQVYSLFNQTPIKFDYYDPDSSYQEDCMAFYYALKEHIQLLQHTTDSTSINQESIYDRFNSL
jgi:hypothetical protein